MFLVRSAFWLGLAIVIIQPQNADFGAQAGILGEKALDTGRQVVSQHVEKVECTSIECIGGKAILAASGITKNPQQASTMQDSPDLILAPVPRPRPARAG